MSTEMTFSQTGKAFIDSFLGFNKTPYELEQDSFVLLLMGKPGSGKSTLCSQIALNFNENNKNRGVIYYSTEEQIDSICLRTKILNNKLFPESKHPDPINPLFPKKDLPNLSSNEDTNLIFKQPNDCNRLAILFPISRSAYLKEICSNDTVNTHLLQDRLTATRIADLSKRIKSDIEYFSKHFGWKEIAIIVDNISTIIESTSFPAPRSFFRLLLDTKLFFKEKLKVAFVFVSEASEIHKFPDYLCDISLLLSYEEESAICQRYLTILKARNLSIEPKRHRMILNETGISLIPGYLKWDKKSKDVDASLCKFEGLNDLNKHLSLPNRGNAGHEQKAEYGFSRGTSTLIYGEHETRKTILSLHFLQNGIIQNEQVTLLTFVPNDTASFDLGGLIMKKNNTSPYYKFHCSSDYLESMSNVENEIYSKTLFTKPIPKRMVLIDLCQLFVRFSEEDVFKSIASIIYNMNKAGIASIFNYTIDRNNQTDLKRISRLRFFFDNMIKSVVTTDYVGIPRVVALKIEKFKQTNIQSPNLQCIFEPKTGQLKLNDAELQNTFIDSNNELRYGDLHVYYFEGETKAFKEHTAYVQQMLETGSFHRRDKDKLFFQLFEGKNIPAGGALLQGIINKPGFLVGQDTSVMMIDEQWIEQISDKLIPISTMASQKDFNNCKTDYVITVNKEKEKQHSFLGPVKIPGTKEDYCALPYYSNFTMLVHNKKLICDFLQKSSEQQKDDNYAYVKNFFNKNGELENHSLTWKDIFKIGKIIAQWGEINDRQITPFYYSYASHECGACMLLALLWDDIEKNLDDKGHLHDFTFLKDALIKQKLIQWLNYAHSEEYPIADPIVQRVATIFPDTKSFAEEILQKINEVFAYPDIKAREKLTDSDTAIKQIKNAMRKYNNQQNQFVFAHTWAVCFISAVENKSEFNDFEIHRVPTLSGDIQNGVSISGNWYLGVLQDSKNPGQGYEIIRQILSKNALDNMFHMRAAIPCKKEYWYRDYPQKEHALMILDRAKSRNDILHYSSFARDIENLFIELIYLKHFIKNQDVLSQKLSDLLEITVDGIKLARDHSKKANDKNK